ncbi:MAG: hypothetical protein ACKESB_00465 [Candidatus Hodgkinia cicadicola]
MMHGVTLGAVGLYSHQPLFRHPNIGFAVRLDVNSTVLSNVQIGHCSIVAVGAVLNKAVIPITLR